MEVIFTNHARYQLKERKVDYIWVEETIKSPDITKKVDNKFYVIRKLNGRTLKVVYVKEKHIKVVTLYWV